MYNTVTACNERMSIVSVNASSAYGDFAGMKQYSRMAADSSCDSCILSGIRGYFGERQFYTGKTLNTQLCYSNTDAIDAMIRKIVTDA